MCDSERGKKNYPSTANLYLGTRTQIYIVQRGETYINLYKPIPSIGDHKKKKKFFQPGIYSPISAGGAVVDVGLRGGRRLGLRGLLLLSQLVGLRARYRYQHRDRDRLRVRRRLQLCRLQLAGSRCRRRRRRRRRRWLRLRLRLRRGR